VICVVSISRYLIIFSVCVCGCVFPSSVGNSSSSFLKKAKKKKGFKIKMKSKILLNSFMRVDAVMCCLVCSRRSQNQCYTEKERERTSS
jgi:hypothetical protein